MPLYKFGKSLIWENHVNTCIFDYTRGSYFVCSDYVANTQANGSNTMIIQFASNTCREEGAQHSAGRCLLSISFGGRDYGNKIHSKPLISLSNNGLYFNAFLWRMMDIDTISTRFLSHIFLPALSFFVSHCNFEQIICMGRRKRRSTGKNMLGVSTVSSHFWIKA